MAKPERLPWGTEYTEITEEKQRKPKHKDFDLLCPQGSLSYFVIHLLLSVVKKLLTL